jgi:hypothetical protein
MQIHLPSKERYRHQSRKLWIPLANLCTFNSWEIWFFHVFRMLWESVNSSQFSSFSKLVLGWWSFLIYSSLGFTAVLNLFFIRLHSPFVGPWPLFQFTDLIHKYTVSRTPWSGDQLVTRPLPTHKRTQTQNECTRRSMPPVGFKPTILVLERAKTVHALDCMATVIGPYINSLCNPPVLLFLLCVAN